MNLAGQPGLHLRLPGPIARWLEYERFYNERIHDRRRMVSIRLRDNLVPAEYRPESGRIWRLQAVILPDHEVRRFGEIRGVPDELGLAVPPGKSVVFVHPLAHDLYRPIIKKYGLIETNILVAPTSSFRTLLAWPATPGRRRGLLLKLSMGARIADLFRINSESHIVRALIVSAMLEGIPAATRRAHGFDFFPETAAMTLDRSLGRRRAIGHIVRRFPKSFRASGKATLIPMFSLMSQRLGSKNRAEQTPPLVRLISASGLSPFIYVLEKIVRPLVHALSYLLFEEGLSVECHSQNILYELDGASELTGKVILRDLTGVRVQIGLRFARGKPFPRCGWFPPHARQIEPLFMGRTVRRSASFFVENFGLRCALWPLTYGLRRYFPSLSYAALKSAYLLLWQEAAVASLHLRPLFKPRRAGLALDEAIDFYLANFPWDALAREHRGSLSSRDLVPLTFAPVRRGRGRIGGRGIAMSWGTIVPGANGSLYLCDRSAGRA